MKTTDPIERAIIDHLFDSYSGRPHLLARFKQWDKDNPHVFKKFKELAALMRKRRDKYSASYIVGKMRWDHDFETKGDPFKINNDFSPIMARLLIWQRNEFLYFFELRDRDDAEGIMSHEERRRRGEGDCDEGSYEE